MKNFLPTFIIRKPHNDRNICVASRHRAHSDILKGHAKTIAANTHKPKYNWVSFKKFVSAFYVDFPVGIIAATAAAVCELFFLLLVDVVQCANHFDFGRIVFYVEQLTKTKTTHILVAAASAAVA